MARRRARTRPGVLSLVYWGWRGGGGVARGRAAGQGPLRIPRLGPRRRRPARFPPRPRRAAPRPSRRPLPPVRPSRPLRPARGAARGWPRGTLGAASRGRRPRTSRRYSRLPFISVRKLTHLLRRRVRRRARHASATMPGRPAGRRPAPRPIRPHLPHRAG